MKLSVSAYRAHAAAHKKILSSYQLNYGSTSASSPSTAPSSAGVVPTTPTSQNALCGTVLSESDTGGGAGGGEESQTDLEDDGGGKGGGGGGDGTNDHHRQQSSHRTSSSGNIAHPQSHHSHQQTVSFGGTYIQSGNGSNQQYTHHHHRGSGSGGGSGSRGGGTQHVRSPPSSTRSPPSLQTSREEDEEEDDSSNADCRSPGQRTKSNQRWMKLRTTVQLSSAISTIQKKPPLKREDSFLKRFSTRQTTDNNETVDDTGSEGGISGDQPPVPRRRRRVIRHPRSVVNPDENFYFYWLLLQTTCVLYNFWTLIVRQSFPELQQLAELFWRICDYTSDLAYILDIFVQLRTGYLEQGLMVYDSKKLAGHYLHSRAFLLDLCALCPLDILEWNLGTQPLLRFPRFLKVYRAINYYYMVESRTVWPNLWRVLNLIHILLILAHWFGCFYFLLSEAEGFQGDWVYPHRPGDYATLSRKYLGSLYWSTLTLTTIGDLPTPETNLEKSTSPDGPKSLPRRGLKSRLLQYNSNSGYVFTIVSYLIGVFIFATIVGQVGNVITNRNANRLEFERLLDGAKTYMRHHKVPGGMKRRVLRWYDYSWSRGRIQGGGDINTALGLLPDKLKTELALHVNLSVLKKVTIFQECQPEFLHDLVLKMKAYIFTPGDTICRKGEVAREMFIIADGILEVLSETGRVLTTMKAGDFFGEIGILCLDGLNKRTADVRSVGYSELFSLSREDVLAAMKDYPEAQEILQALGRKRLMEVKCSNAAAARKAANKIAAASSSRWHHIKGSLPGVGSTIDPQSAFCDNGGSTDSDATTPRRIVDKIKCEAKGLRKVLRKSRASRRSGDSIELQPLHTSGQPKGVLRRMSRVRSDDQTHPNDDVPGSTGAPISEPPVCSPLGAGLPLLSRLRLLKEKQDREEVDRQALTPQIAPVIPPQPDPPPDVSPEVIGAGLPLLQRLLLLKAKETREAAAVAAVSTTTFGVASSSSSSTTKETIPVPLVPNISSSKESSSVSPTPTTPSIIEDKLTKDVSPKSNNHSSSSNGPPSSSQNIFSFNNNNNNSNNNTNNSSTSSSNNTIVPPTPIKLTKPWTKLKKAAILSSSDVTTNSLNLSVPSSSSNCSSSKIITTQTLTTPKISPTLSRVPDIISDNNTSALDKRDYHSHHQSDNAHLHNIVIDSDSDCDFNKQTRLTFERRFASSISSRKRKPCMLHVRTKNYLSIDDLSPEYCGLPFVKKLKILNERQKLAELESVVKIRSASLDYPDTMDSLNIQDTLTRSHSEACAMQCHGTLCVPMDMYPPLSPESNETPERRTLKSILKNLSSANQDQASQTQRNTPEIRRLMRAPTIEGYAARHSKLAKSVTFNRDTLQSPPQDARAPMLFSMIPSTCRGHIIDCSTQTEEDGTTVESFIAAKNREVKFLHNVRSIFSSESTVVPGPLDEVVVGSIKQVIQCHLQEMQTKFQSLELEIKRRDEVICQLQSRIQELERLSATVVSTNPEISAADDSSTQYSESLQGSLESPHVILDLDCSDDGVDDQSQQGNNAH